MIRLKGLLPLVLTMALFTSCAGSGDRALPDPTQTLRPFLRQTQTPTVRGIPPTLPTSAPLGPTPTPLIHVIQSGETLLWVAIRYGIELDDLLLANPGIDPELLSIGTELIIPSEGGEPVDTLLPTPTPVALELSPVRCFASPSEGTWCLTTVLNSSHTDVEGVVGLVTLIDADGQVFDRQIAYSPLNRIPIDGWMPIAAYFASTPKTHLLGVADLLSAVPVNEADLRYLDVLVEIESSELSIGEHGWRVRGMVELAAKDVITPANIRIVLVALNDAEEVVGFRIWDEKTAEDAREKLPFDITVFSLDVSIDRIEIFAEAVPSP